MALDLFGGADTSDDQPVIEGIPVGTVWMAAHVADSIASGPVGPSARSHSHHDFLFGEPKAHVDPRLAAFYPDSFLEKDDSKLGPQPNLGLANRPGGRPFKLVKLKNVFSPDEIGDLPRLSKDQLLKAVQQQVGHVDSLAEPQEGSPLFLRRSQIEQIEEALKRAEDQGKHGSTHSRLGAGSEQPEDIMKHLQLTEDGRPSFPVEAGVPQEELLRNLHVTKDGRPSPEDIQAAMMRLRRVGITKDRPPVHVDVNHGDSEQPLQFGQVRVTEAGFHFDLSALKMMKTALLVTGGFVSKLFGLGIVGFMAWQSMQANVVGSHQRAAARQNSATSGRPVSQPRFKSD